MSYCIYACRSNSKSIVFTKFLLSFLSIFSLKAWPKREERSRVYEYEKSAEKSDALWGDKLLPYLGDNRLNFRLWWEVFGDLLDVVIFVFFFYRLNPSFSSYFLISCCFIFFHLSNFLFFASLTPFSSLSYSLITCALNFSISSFLRYSSL